MNEANCEVCLPDDLDVPEWEEGKDTRTLNRYTHRIVTEDNFTEVVQWRDGSLSVHTRLPDLDGIGMRDRYYHHLDTAYSAAIGEFNRRTKLFEQLQVVVAGSRKEPSAGAGCDAREGQDRMGDEEYVEADGQNCPFCGADGTQRAFDNVEICGQLATQSVRCMECGEVVVDYYQLVGYKEEGES